MIENILDFVFAPLTVFRALWKNDGYFIPTLLSFVVWIIFVVVAWNVVGPAASPIFQITTGVVGFLLTLYFKKKTPETDTGSLLGFFFYIFAGIIAGYTFGLVGHTLFLLY
jgi:hypothetical protein